MGRIKDFWGNLFYFFIIIFFKRSNVRVSVLGRDDDPLSPHAMPGAGEEGKG